MKQNHILIGLGIAATLGLVYYLSKNKSTATTTGTETLPSGVPSSFSLKSKFGDMVIGSINYTFKDGKFYSSPSYGMAGGVKKEITKKQYVDSWNTKRPQAPQATIHLNAMPITDNDLSIALENFKNRQS